MSIPKDLKDALAKVFVNKEEKSEVKDDAKSFKFSFGKHNGKTLEEVEQIDFDYITWLKQQDWIKEPLKTYLKEF